MAALTRELHLRRQELRALLDITEAVNNEELPEEALYRSFGFTLLGQLGYGAVALLVPAENAADPPAWGCRISLPNRHEFRNTPLPAALCALGSGVTAVPVAEVEARWHAFRWVVPVQHHERLLAFVLLGESLRGKTVADYSDQETIAFVQTLGSIVLVAAQNRTLARERLARQVLQREVEIAREVQQMLFPKRLPATAAIDVYATYIPHARVGGDYYDCMDLGHNRYLLCVADVSGKGIPASLLMSNFQAGLRTLGRRADPLPAILRELNHLIYTNAQAEKFITAFVGVYDANRRELCYVNAGHNPPLLARPGRSYELLEAGTLMLGIVEDLPNLEEGRIDDLPPGSVLLIYTDGLTDVFDPTGADFGEAGVAASFARNQALPLPELHTELLADIARHSPMAAEDPHPFPDDITILSARFK